MQVAPVNLDASERRGSGSAGIAVLLCFLVALLEGFDLQVIGVAAPLIARDLGIGPDQSGWLFSASLVGLAIGAVVGGRLADRRGRKPVLIAAVAIFGLFTLAAAASTGFSSLLLFRFLTGLGLGGSMPNIIALVSEKVRPENVTRSVSAMVCGLSAGGVLVAQLARLLPPDMGWRALFVIGGVLPLMLVPLLWIGLTETARPMARAGQPRRSYWTDLFGDGQGRVTIALWLVFSLTLMQLSMLLNWLPSLVIAKGMDRQLAFLAATILNIGGIVGSLAIGWLCDRFGARWPMLIVYAAMAAALYGLSLVATAQPLLALAFVAGFLVLGAQFALYGLSPRVYPGESRASGVGAAVAVGRIGAIAGPILAGQMLAGGRSADSVLLLMVPLVALAGVAMLALAAFTGRSLAPQS